MKVILTQDVPKLGGVGEVVDVAGGFGRNYLLPRKMAVLADPRNINRIEHEKRVIESAQRKAEAEAREVAGQLDGTVVKIAVKVGEQGKLYGSVNSRDVQAKLKDAGHTVERKAIQLDEAIREVGTFEVSVKVHSNVTATIKVEVVGEEI